MIKRKRYAGEQKQQTIPSGIGHIHVRHLVVSAENKSKLKANIWNLPIYRGIYHESVRERVKG